MSSVQQSQLSLSNDLVCNHTTSRRFKAAWVDLLPLIVGCTLPFATTIVGQLTIAEIVILSTFPFAMRNVVRAIRRFSVRFNILLLLVYLVGQLVTDFVRDSQFDDAVRGNAKVAMLLVCYLWIEAIFQLKFRAFALYIIGSSLASAVIILQQGALDPTLFKLGGGQALASLIISVPILFRFRGAGENYKHINGNMVSLLLIVLGVFSLFMNSRSFASICLLAGLMGFAQKLIASISLRFGYVGVFMIICAAISGIYFVYVIGNENTFFGETAAAKYNDQVQGGGVLFSSRGEYAGAIPAIWDSPLLGHGSWAKNVKYVELHCIAHGIERGSSEWNFFMERELIMTHSHILGAWVEAGIAGGLFWLATLIVVSRTLVKSARYLPTRQFVFASLILLLFIWNIVFSPFGQARRVGNAASLALCMLVQRLGRESSNADLSD